MTGRKLAQIIVFVLSFIVGAILGNALVFGDDIGCIYDGDPAFAEGGNEWCKAGHFERIHVDWDKDTTLFSAYFVLNEPGKKQFDESHIPLFTSFAHMLGNIGAAGGNIKSTIQIRHGGNIIAVCRLREDETYVYSKCTLVESEQA